MSCAIQDLNLFSKEYGDSRRIKVAQFDQVHLQTTASVALGAGSRYHSLLDEEEKPIDEEQFEQVDETVFTPPNIRFTTG